MEYDAINKILEPLEKGIINTVEMKDCVLKIFHNINIDSDKGNRLFVIWDKFYKNNELNERELKKVLRELKGIATIDKNETDEINEYLNEGWQITDELEHQYIMKHMLYI